MRFKEPFVLLEKYPHARLLIVHSISSETEDFYLDHGFIRLPVETLNFPLILSSWSALLS